MTVRYKLEITRMVHDSDGIVTRVYWRLTGSEKGKHQSAVGSVEMGPAGDSPTPYGDLTEAQVKKWLKGAAILDEYKQRIEAALAEDAAAVPAVQPRALPWMEKAA